MARGPFGPAYSSKLTKLETARSRHRIRRWLDKGNNARSGFIWFLLSIYQQMFVKGPIFLIQL